VELYQNQEWGFRQRDKALRGMHYFDKVLQRQPFIAGDKFSMADITVIGGLVFAAIVNLDIPPECRALLSWFERVKKRESVATQPAFLVEKFA
jgi:glutathione S-transferase